MKLPRPAFILSVVVAAVLIVGGLGALLLPRIVDTPDHQEKCARRIGENDLPPWLQMCRFWQSSKVAIG